MLGFEGIPPLIDIEDNTGGVRRAGDTVTPATNIQFPLLGIISNTAYSHASSPSSRSTRTISNGVVATSSSGTPNFALTAYKEFPFLMAVVWTSNRGLARERGATNPQDRSGERETCFGTVPPATNSTAKGSEYGELVGQG